MRHYLASSALDYIWILWSLAVVVQLLHDFGQYVTVFVMYADLDERVVCSFGYESCDRSERRFRWEHLLAIHPGSMFWLVEDDFNTLLSQDERCGGRDCARGLIHKFQDFVD